MFTDLGHFIFTKQTSDRGSFRGVAFSRRINVHSSPAKAMNQRKPRFNIFTKG